MSYPTVTNTAFQWTPEGSSSGLPAALPSWHHYHLKRVDMGHKKKASYHAAADSYHPTDSYRLGEQHATQSYRPTDSYIPNPLYAATDSWRPPPYDQWRPQPSAQGFSASLPWRSQPTSRQQNLQSRGPTPPIGPVSSNMPPWRMPENSNPPTQHSNQFRAQAPAFRLGQSRYNFRSRQQCSFSTAVADQVVQSIETDNELQVPNLPIRMTPSRKPTPRREPTPINTRVTPVPVPQPSTIYNEHAQQAPVQVDQPRKLLVLLDLNGTLVYRHGPQRQYSVKRPGVDRLLEYLFENHAVLIFTSATMRSAEKMAHEILTPKQYSELITIRAREHFGLRSDQFYNKVQVYKDLNKIWTVQEVKQSVDELGTKWDMTNTVLIDDSVEKAKSHPHNLLQVPEFKHPTSNSKKSQQQWIQSETNIMLDVEAKLEELRCRSSVACQIRQWQRGEKSSPGETSKKVEDSKFDAIKEGGTEAKVASGLIEETTGYPMLTSMRRDSSNDDVDEKYHPEQLQVVDLPTLAVESLSVSCK